MSPVRLALLLLPTALAACGGARSGPESPAAPEQGGDGSALEIAAAPAGSEDAAQDTERSAGHTFTPRERPPHLPVVAQPVALDRLPPLRTALEECFWGARGRVLAPPPPPPPRRPRPQRARPSGVGAGAVPAAPAPADAAGAAAPPAVAAAPLGGAAAPPGGAAAPPAPAAPAAAPRRAESKDAAEASRAAERAQPAAPEAGEAERAAAPSGYYDWGAAIYLSNDDSMSLSSAQRVIYAIDRFLPIPSAHVRPHELLNYFSFETAPPAPESDFSVLAELQAKPGQPGIYSLGLSISGRDPSRLERRHAALTFVIDRSGSMRDEGRMEYLKRGLLRMTNELKAGDLVNLVLFDDQVCAPVQHFVVGRDRMELLREAISRLAPRGATDLHAGLERGYALANTSYQPTHSNRVILITDALANSGVTDAESISLIAQNYDRRRIRLSGVGVGSEFNDGLLDRLTERGRGAYVFLGSEAEVDAVFGQRFTSLIETVANDVHFRLHLPPSLAMNVFYGEESSTYKEDVLPIHYFAGTSQLFLSDLRARDGELRPEDGLMLSIEYENAETGAPQIEEFAFELGRIEGSSHNLPKARLIVSFIDGLADTVKGEPPQVAYRARGWEDDAAFAQCERGRESLARQAFALSRDPEVTRVLGLWDKYCSRYRASERAREPVRRIPPRGRDVWPSAAK